MKTNNVILIAVLFLIIGIIISAWYIKSKNVCYDLPEHGGMEVWGKKYWFALHDIVDRIPCGICQTEATGFMKFFHDFVNNKKSVELYDSENFYNWVNRISALKKVE